MVYCTFFFAFSFFSVSVEERNFGFACVALALGSAQLSACNKPIKREGGGDDTNGRGEIIFLNT
jgi:predicted small secreted protein